MRLVSAEQKQAGLECTFGVLVELEGSDDGKMSDTMASLAKCFCTVKARHVCHLARDVLGGNGILLDFHVMRHLCDMEALVTYEGTAEIQTLIVGRDITGQSAFA